MRQHILHGVQLIGVWKQLSNSRAIASLGAVCVPHRPKSHEVWHIWHICHAILEVVEPIEVIISLTNLHIIERESLRHLIGLSILRKLLLVGKEILICILAIVQIIIGIIRCPLILDRLLIIVLFLLLLLLLRHQLGHIGCWTLIRALILSLVLLGGICVHRNLILLDSKPYDVNGYLSWNLGLILLRKKVRLWVLAIKVLTSMVQMTDVVLVTWEINLVIVLGGKLWLPLDNETLVLVVGVYWIACPSVVFTLRWIWWVMYARWVKVLFLLWADVLLNNLTLCLVGWWRLKIWFPMVSCDSWCSHLVLLGQGRGLTQRRKSLLWLQDHIILLLLFPSRLFLGSTSCCCCSSWVQQCDSFCFFKLLLTFFVLILHLHLRIIKSFYKVNLGLRWLSFFRLISFLLLIWCGFLWALLRSFDFFDWGSCFGFFSILSDSRRYWSSGICLGCSLLNCQQVLRLLFFEELLSLLGIEFRLWLDDRNRWLCLDLSILCFLM